MPECCPICNTELLGGEYCPSCKRRVVDEQLASQIKMLNGAIEGWRRVNAEQKTEIIRLRQVIGAIRENHTLPHKHRQGCTVAMCDAALDGLDKLRKEKDDG